MPKRLAHTPALAATRVSKHAPTPVTSMPSYASCQMQGLLRRIVPSQSTT